MTGWHCLIQLSALAAILFNKKAGCVIVMGKTSQAYTLGGETGGWMSGETGVN